MFLCSSCGSQNVDASVSPYVCGDCVAEQVTITRKIPEEMKTYLAVQLGVVEAMVDRARELQADVLQAVSAELGVDAGRLARFVTLESGELVVQDAPMPETEGRTGYVEVEVAEPCATVTHTA